MIRLGREEEGIHRWNSVYAMSIESTQRVLSTV